MAQQNILDRVVAYFSPTRGLSRARARHATRLYEGADRGRRGASFNNTGGSSVNTELSIALTTLRDRSRDLAQNNPWAARMLDVLASHTVGNGIVPVSNTGSDKIDNRVNSLWQDFVSQADVRGLQTFYGMQTLAVKSMVQSGDVVVRFIDTELRDDEAVPLKLQLLEADFIDHSREGLFGVARSGSMPDGVERNRLGVGLGKFDEWRGLWLWPRHPGEQTTFGEGFQYISDFISRDDLAHVFKHDRPGQVRGVPWFAPILQLARDTDDIRDAANLKAKAEACFAGFITNSDESMPIFEDNGSMPTIPGAVISTLEPGMLKELRTGQDIKFAQPTSTSQLETILLVNLQAMAAGVGCTYDQATGDLRQANYSSLRAGKIEFWRLIGMLQEHVVIPMLCERVWKRFIKNAVLAGRLPDRGRKNYPVRWVVPAKEMIDPKKDFDATKNLVRSGAITPQQFMASFGGDWRTNIAQFKAFYALAKESDLTLDIMSSVDQRGRTASGTGAGDTGSQHGQADVQDAEDGLDGKADESDD